MGRNLKAIFFGKTNIHPDLMQKSPLLLNKSIPNQDQSASMSRFFAGTADMDDTLVLTGDADTRAYTDAMNLARRLHAQVRLKCN